MLSEPTCTIFVEKIEANLKASISELLAHDTGDPAWPAQPVRYQVEIVKNFYTDPAKRKKCPEKFLYFAKRIEIYSSTGRAASPDHSAKLVSGLLEHLSSRGIRAVASYQWDSVIPCDQDLRGHDAPWF